MPIRILRAITAVLLGAAVSCSGARPSPEAPVASSAATASDNPHADAAARPAPTNEGPRTPADRQAARPEEPSHSAAATAQPAAQPATKSEEKGEAKFASAEAAAAFASGPDAHPLSKLQALARREADAKAYESPLELVETAPVETTLALPGLREAKDVWPAMFGRANTKIDLSEFYLSDEPHSALEPSIEALEAAAARGVKIRLIADSKMGETYPETIALLEKQPNVKVEIIDYKKLAGGVQHAKYFIVDGAEAYEGSQNFDWRSLSQIQEVGLRFRAPEAVRALEDVFETDWALAGGADRSTRVSPKSPYRFPTPAGNVAGGGAGKDEGSLTFVASPKGWLPDESLWDLPAMVRLIDSAKSSVKVQVLTYRAHSRREDFPELEDALKRAAARGVQVNLLVSHWSLRKGTVEGLQALEAWRPAQGKPIAVSVLTIPQLSSGYLPFARVSHAKFMVIDGARAWVGTNNWERDYFFQTRNVGLIVDGGAVPAQLEQLFDGDLKSSYAEPLEPDRTYPSPHTGP